MKTAILSFTLFLATFTIGFQAQAQYNFPGSKGPKNLEINLGYLLGKADFTYQYSNFDENTNTLFDTSFTENLNSAIGYSVGFAYSWPVARLSPTSRLFAGVGFSGNVFAWTTGDTEFYNPNTNTFTTTNQNASAQWGLPIGIDWRIGPEANYDKSLRSAAGLGIGVLPSFNVLTYHGFESTKGTVQPYVRGEFGFFAGIVMKLRATYTLGGITLLDETENGFGGGTSRTTFRQKPSLALSLVLLPFSWKYQRTDW